MNFISLPQGVRGIFVIKAAGVDVTAGPLARGQYIYGRASQTEQRSGPLGQLIFSGHLGQQLSFLPCHLISTDNRLMKGLGAIRAKIGPTSDVDKIFSKMYSQYVLFINKYS